MSDVKKAASEAVEKLGLKLEGKQFLCWMKDTLSPMIFDGEDLDDDLHEWASKAAPGDAIKMKDGLVCVMVKNTQGF